METLIQLLERKNLCFRSFHKLCADFIDEIAKGDTTNLDDFQRRRQALIKVLEQLETEVSQLLTGFKDTLTLSDKNQISVLYREKDSTVKAILDLDQQILSHIDRLRDETIQKLQNLQAGKKTIGAYRSPIDSVESAENHKAFDREA